MDNHEIYLILNEMLNESKIMLSSIKARDFIVFENSFNNKDKLLNKLKYLNLSNEIYSNKIQELIHIDKKITTLVEQLLIEISANIYDNKAEMNNINNNKSKIIKFLSYDIILNGTDLNKKI